MNTNENIEKIENVEEIDIPEITDITTDELTPLPEPPESDKKVKAERKAGWLVRDIFEWGETLISAVIIIVVIFTFFVRVTSIDGPSMNPTLHNKDQMLVTNFFYTPKRNDIVVIYAPKLSNDKGGYGKDIIKRVIGVAGDEIKIKTPVYGDEDFGRVFLNGDTLSLYIDDEGRLVEDGHFISALTESRRPTDIELTVPEGYVFVLGDNRINSTDSRCFTVDLVNINHIAGKAFFRVAGDSEVYGSLFKAIGFVK